MPEGPEVKRIGENLARLISGKTLENIDILSGRYIKKPPSGWTEIQQQLPTKVIGPGVHGKFLYWICSDETFIFNTLGLSGFWSSSKDKHSRVKFSFRDGTCVYFSDQRSFGTIKFVRGKHQMIEKLTSLGPDMLAGDISDQDFIALFRKKPTWPITKLLMDQSIIAGVGNYIKADSLYLSQISPHRTIADISDGELAVLNRSIKQIMHESYTKTVTNNYPDKFLIYGKTIDIDGNKIIKEETADKRTTYWVPKVQK